VTSARISRLQHQIKPGELFYVTNLLNIRYLTGFTGSNAALMVSESDAILATDSRYELQVRQQVPDLPSVIGRNFPELLLSKESKFEVLVEGSSLAINSYQNLVKNFDHNFITTSGIIENLRVVKDESEVELIKTACEISTQAFSDLIKTVKIGQSEKHIRNILENRMRELGAMLRDQMKEDQVTYIYPAILKSYTHTLLPYHA
jgi:Xaa-Pro aminopeptidase